MVACCLGFDEFLSGLLIQKVIHTVKIDMVKQIVDVENSGKSADEIDKETVSFGEIQLKQKDRSCVHASIELHLHVVHVVPNKNDKDTPLEVFNNEVSRLSRMDDDLFTYKVEVANIPCHSNMDDDSEHEADDDVGYDPSDVAFIGWLGSRFFNYKTMDHYTMKALWIYWIRRDDEVSS
ncbi:hypothetical protein Tco_0669188 [Tanacetum coccineum]